MLSTPAGFSTLTAMRDSVRRARRPRYATTALVSPLGGPVVIPKVYNGQNKTFFFSNMDWTRFRSGVLPGFGNTTPIDAFKAGDFSSILTDNQIGTDALGRPILEGEIFNPATTQLVGGVPVRDPYPGNIIPADDPLRSAVASRIAALMVHPDRPGVAFNVAGNPADDQTWLLNARNIEFRVDHAFTSEFPNERKLLLESPALYPELRRSGRLRHPVQRRDRTPKEQLILWQRLLPAYFHPSRPHPVRLDHSPQPAEPHHHCLGPLVHGRESTVSRGGLAGVTVGGTNHGGILDNTAGPPELDFYGNIPYNSLGTYGWGNFGFLTNNRWQFSDDLSWVKGKHTIKVGFEYRWHQFPFVGLGHVRSGRRVRL